MRIKKYLNEFLSDDFLEKKIIWIANGITFLFIFVAILTIFYYFFSVISLNSVKKELYKLQNERQPLEERELKKKSEKLRLASFLLQKQVRAKRVFEFLEKSLLKDVEIKKLSLSFEKESLILSIESFSALPLAWQINIFKKDPSVKEVKLLKINFDKKNNRTIFDLEIKLDPNLWKS